jgi:hypothetical protein
VLAALGSTVIHLAREVAPCLSAAVRWLGNCFAEASAYSACLGLNNRIALPARRSRQKTLDNSKLTPYKYMLVVVPVG